MPQAYEVLPEWEIREPQNKPLIEFTVGKSSQQRAGDTKQKDDIVLDTYHSMR